MGATKEALAQPKVSKEMQEKAQLYEELHSQYKAIERQMNALRKEIEPYMEKKGLEAIGRIRREPRRMPLISARYTTYDIDDMFAVLPANTVADCVVEVIDKDVVDAYIKLGIIPEEITEIRKLNSTMCLVVR